MSKDARQRSQQTPARAQQPRRVPDVAGVARSLGAGRRARRLDRSRGSRGSRGSLGPWGSRGLRGSRALRLESSSVRGFSLMEVMIASATAIIVLSIIMSVWVNVEKLALRGRLQAQLEREVQLAGRLLTQDLRPAGLGVPSGGHIQRDCSGRCVSIYGSVAPARFYASVIVAGPTEVGIVADLVRPNAQYNTFGGLSTYRTGGRDTLAWHTENNGACVTGPPGNCVTGDSSFFFPGENGCSVRATDRNCAWGMNRVQPGDRVQIVAGNGNWSHAAASSPLTLSAPFGLNALALSVPFDRGGGDTVWTNTQEDGAGPGGIPGAGWVTTLDRVFYRQNGNVLERIQCWGDPDPDHPQWPDASAPGIPAAPALTPVTAGATVAANVCTAPDVIARFVETFRVRYFTSGGAEVGAPATSQAAKSSIRRIDFELTLRRPSPIGREIKKTTVGSVRLPNLG